MTREDGGKLGGQRKINRKTKTKVHRPPLREKQCTDPVYEKGAWNMLFEKIQPIRFNEIYSACLQ